MKKQILAAASFILVVALSACGGVTTQEHNALIAERDELLSQKEALTQECETLRAERDASALVTATISGYFTAYVQTLMPDYCTDDTIPRVAVVTCFQSLPFTVFLGEELISQVKVGEAYVFEIREAAIELTQQELDSFPPAPDVVLPLYDLSITSIRPAEEADLGLDSYSFVYTPVN